MIRFIAGSSFIGYSKLICTFIVLQSMALGAFDHGREILPSSWKKDATINDVYFVNETHGWAVGDQGLILRTENGGIDWIQSEGAGLDLDHGRTFEQKLSHMRPISKTHELYSLTCSLKSVFFLDRQRGWIAGSYYTAYLGRSHSVLLKTEDGGRSWKPLESALLPQINRLYFQDVLGGWALGRSGGLFKSGIVTTFSAGRRWTSQSVDPPRHWVDGELVPSGFVVIDDNGVLGKIIGNEFEAAVVMGRRAGKMRAVRMLNAKTGWAVGDSGTILLTQDGGHSWKTPPRIASDSRLRHFDFSTVAVRDNRVWIAGNPGTFVISLDPNGKRAADFRPTSTASPLCRLYFPDRDHGWAVGAFGMILHTKDGGQSWQKQRSNHDRVAVMVASPSPRTLPFAALAQFANEDSLLCANVVMGRHPELDLEIAASATLRVGCAFNTGLLGEDRDTEDASIENARALEELVRAIRTLRPNVLVCNQDLFRSSADFLVSCRTAIELANDAQAYPEQLASTRLSTWQVDRFLIRTDTASGELNLSGKRYLPRSGKLVEDQIAISRGLTQLSPVYDEAESYRVESFTGSVSARRGDIFFGLSALGRVIPKRTEPARLGNLNSIATAPLKHQEFERLLNMPLQTAEQESELCRHIQSFGTGQESREVGIWMMQLAEEFLRAGKLEMAAYTMEQMVGRLHDHAFTPAALMWLAQYYSSDEVSSAVIARGLEPSEEQSVPEKIESVEDIEALLAESNSDFAVAHSIPTSIEENGVRQVTWQPVETELDAPSNSQWSASAEDVAAALSFRRQQANINLNRLKQRDPDLAQSVHVQFMEAHIVKKTPGDLSNQNLLKRLKRTQGTPIDFALAARRELDAFGATGQRQQAVCYQTPNRPLLDGILDDEVWQGAVENGQAFLKTMTVVGGTTTRRTDVFWMAFDDEFLYIAGRCNKLPNKVYRSNNHPRSRDPDLQRHERVRLVLDFDRDLQSEFVFEIDSQGRAAERCAGAIGWNPEWFVASGQDKRAWMFECAIPLTELSSEPIDEHTLVAFAASRLDHNSLDLWSPEKTRSPLPSEAGIMAGLKISPNRHNFLRFVHAPAEGKPSTR